MAADDVDPWRQDEIDLANEDRYVPIEGWRDAPSGVGPHPEAESCDLPPSCGHIYRKEA